MASELLPACRAGTGLVDEMGTRGHRRVERRMPERDLDRPGSGAADPPPATVSHSRHITGGVQWKEYARNAEGLHRCRPRSSARSPVRVVGRRTRRGLRTSGPQMKRGPPAEKEDRSAGAVAEGFRRLHRHPSRRLLCPVRSPGVRAEWAGLSRRNPNRREASCSCVHCAAG